MPFRAKLKAAFGRTSDESADLNKTISKQQDKARRKNKNKTRDEFANWPENVYKPYEIPEPKYKRTPAKEHTQKLEAFSFGGGLRDSIRRLSHTSQYSPMGSRLPSRAGSLAAGAKGSAAGASRPPPSRSQSLAQQSVAEEDEEAPEGGLARVKSSSSARRQRSSRPGTSAPHEPIQEHSSAERSPGDSGDVSPGGGKPDGAPLETTETVRPRADTVRQTDFSGAELAQALTAIRVERAPAAVGA